MKIYRVASTGTAHLTDAVDPICGARVGAGSVTWGDVTCKRCLKWVESRKASTAPAEVAEIAEVPVIEAAPEVRVAFTVANTGERREGTVIGSVTGEFGRVALRVRDDQGAVWSPWEADTFPVERATRRLSDTVTYVRGVMVDHYQALSDQDGTKALCGRTGHPMYSPIPTITCKNCVKRFEALVAKEEAAKAGEASKASADGTKEEPKTPTVDTSMVETVETGGRYFLRCLTCSDETLYAYPDSDLDAMKVKFATNHPCAAGRALIASVSDTMTLPKASTDGAGATVPAYYVPQSSVDSEAYATASDITDPGCPGCGVLSLPHGAGCPTVRDDVQDALDDEQQRAGVHAGCGLLVIDHCGFCDVCPIPSERCECHIDPDPELVTVTTAPVTTPPTFFIPATERRALASMLLKAPWYASEPREDVTTATRTSLWDRRRKASKRPRNRKGH